MKPRTKKEMMLCKMAGQLPRLTEKQLTYPREHIHPHKGYYWKSGLIWCQCCGELYPNTHNMLEVSLELGVDICPNCGKEIKLEHARPKMKCEEVTSSYAIMTTYKGWQVIRAFDARRLNTKGSPTKYYVDETFQLWIDEKGRETIVSHQYTRNYNFMHWHYSSEFVIYNHNYRCSGYYEFPDLFNLYGFHIYPRTKVIQTVRRNGWSSEMLKLRVNQATLIEQLLTNTRIETIAKAGQYSVLEYWMRQGHGVMDSEYFTPVKIAIRNGYIVEDATLWYDMIESLQKLNKDVHNAYYICPADLTRAHDYYMERVSRKERREKYEKQRERISKENTSYTKRMARYIGIIFGDDNLNLHVLRDVTEFFDEGEAMHHCVYNNGYYKKDDTLIMSARSQGNRVATIEIDLKTMSVIQVRGKRNTVPPKDKEIRKLIDDNMKTIKKIKKLHKTA